MKGEIHPTMQLHLRRAVQDVAVDALQDFPNREFDADLLSRVQNVLCDNCIVSAPLTRLEIEFCRSVFREARMQLVEEVDE